MAISISSEVALDDEGLEVFLMEELLRISAVGAALTRSVIRSKYTSKLKNTSYVVGQYLCIRLK